MHKCFAFTLAEALITLTVIGIVAVMTIPNLVQNYQTKVVETRLQKFYSFFNQAIRLSELNNGPASTWDYGLRYEDEKGNHPIDASEDYINKGIANFQRYLVPYMRGTIDLSNMEKCKSVRFRLADGSSFYFMTYDFTTVVFYPGNIEKCLKIKQPEGVCRFTFTFMPQSGNSELLPFTSKTGSNNYYNWDGVDSLYNACKNNGVYCTALIKSNNWKIPKDYPYKVKF